MITKAHFRIIGRIGSINTMEKVTHISIASDRRMKDDKGNWVTLTDWNSATVFSTKLRKSLSAPNVSNKGNLIAIEGSIQSSSYLQGEDRVYTTSLVAQDFEVLSFAKDAG